MNENKYHCSSSGAFEESLSPIYPSEITGSDVVEPNCDRQDDHPTA
nr:hypothetical protein [Chroococcidiopsis cubana]